MWGVVIILSEYIKIIETYLNASLITQFSNQMCLSLVMDKWEEEKSTLEKWQFRIIDLSKGRIIELLKSILIYSYLWSINTHAEHDTDT